MRRGEEDAVEHNVPSDNSSPSQNLMSNIEHNLAWLVICNTTTRRLTRKILVANFIALLTTSINDQIDSNLLHPHKNGTT